MPYHSPSAAVAASSSNSKCCFITHHSAHPVLITRSQQQQQQQLVEVGKKTESYYFFKTKMVCGKAYITLLHFWTSWIFVTVTSYHRGTQGGRGVIGRISTHTQLSSQHPCVHHHQLGLVKHLFCSVKKVLCAPDLRARHMLSKQKKQMNKQTHERTNG